MSDETRWAKLQRLSLDLAERLRLRATLGRERARVSRLEARIESEKTRIGRALYPLVENAEIRVGLPEVQEGVETIARLRDEIRRSYRRIEQIEKGEPD